MRRSLAWCSISSTWKRPRSITASTAATRATAVTRSTGTRNTAMAGRTEPTDKVGASRAVAVAAGVMVLACMGYQAVRYGVTGTAVANATRELDRMGRVRNGEVASWWREDLARAAAEVPADPFAQEAL